MPTASIWDILEEMNSPKVDGFNLEGSTLDLLHEFFGGYFKGATVSIDGSEHVFPQVKIETQISPELNTGIKSSIAILWMKPGKIHYETYEGRRKGVCRTQFLIYFRCAGDNQGDGGPKVKVRQIADLTHGLLNHKLSTLPLARKGVQTIRAGQHILVSDAQFQMRQMLVTATLGFTAELLP